MKKSKTLRGLKSYAKKLKRDRGIKHSAALEAAAKEQGYANYQQAHTALAAAEVST